MAQLYEHDDLIIQSDFGFNISGVSDLQWVKISVFTSRLSHRNSACPSVRLSVTIMISFGTPKFEGVTLIEGINKSGVVGIVDFRPLN